MITPLDQLIQYKHEAIKAISNNVDVIKLISNNPNIDMDSEEAYAIIDNNFFDCSFCDDTFQTDKAVIFVEAIMKNRPSVDFKGMKLLVQVICNKEFINISPSLFKGLLGNRRDNIARIIADILEGSTEFGIGDLQLTNCEPCSTPNGFTGISLVFDAVDFMEKDYED